MNSLYFAVVEKYSSILELYNKVLDLALYKRITRIGCPECGIPAMDFTVHGYYTRYVIDLIPETDENNQLVVDKNGNIVFKEYMGKEDRIQMKVARIKCKDDGSTHALLFQFVVPYSHYSLRYIIYHIHNMVNSEGSMEAYCNTHGISIKTMREWIKHLEVTIPLLQQVNLIPETDQMDESEAEPNAKNQGDDEATYDVAGKKALSLRIVIQWIYNHFETFYRAALKYLTRVPFQKHKSPPNTVYQFPEI